MPLRAALSQMTAELGVAAKSFDMCIPPHFALIIRAFATIEGVALRFDPKFAIIQVCHWP